MKLYGFRHIRDHDVIRHLFYSEAQAEEAMKSRHHYKLEYDSEMHYYNPITQDYGHSFKQYHLFEVDTEDSSLLRWRQTYDPTFAQPSWPLHNYDIDVSWIHYSPDPEDNLLYFINLKGKLEAMKPGRFLKRFIPDLTKIQVEYYARWFLDRKMPPVKLTGTVKFAKTPEEIEMVYRLGPDSCMLRKAAPRVYGAGDLAIAYLEGDNGSMMARCLVNLNTKTYLRIYSDSYQDDEEVPEGWSAVLEEHLRNLEYRSFQEQEDGFDGARILKIESNVDDNGEEYPEDGYIGYVLPYFDWGLRLNMRTWTVDRYHSSEKRHLLIDPGNTNGLVLFERKRVCAVCGQPSLTAGRDNRINHTDFGEDTELCPEHRDIEWFEDARSHQRWFGTPNYIDAHGNKYGLTSVKNMFWKSQTGTYHPRHVTRLLDEEGGSFAEEEAESLGLRYDTSIHRWTLRSEKEIQDEIFYAKIREEAAEAYYDARLGGSGFYDLVWRVDRPAIAEYAEIQAASRF